MTSFLIVCDFCLCTTCHRAVFILFCKCAIVICNKRLLPYLVYYISSHHARIGPENVEFLKYGRKIQQKTNYKH